MALRMLMLAAVATALLGYYLHSSLPDAIEDQWRLKVIIAGFRLGNLLTSLGTRLGYDTSLNISRQVFGSMFAMTSRSYNDQGLVITNIVVDDIPTRVYRPDDVTEGELLPLVIYYHGGGMITFSVDTYENILRQMAKEVRAVIVAMNYRLAPEYPYPAPLDDCVLVTRHVIRHAASFHGDATRIALTGDSAGGYLAAAVSLRLAEEPEKHKPKLQVLIYPMLQAFDFKLPSYVVMSDVMHEIISGPPIAAAWYMYCTGKPPSNVDLLGLMSNNHTSKVTKQSTFAHYVSLDLMDKKWILKTPPSSKSMMYDPNLASVFEDCLTDPYFSPLMTRDFSQFPPSYVMTAEYDILRDEGVLFIGRLKAAGVKFYHDHIQTGWHGVVSYTTTGEGRRALNNVIEFLNKHL